MGFLRFFALPLTAREMSNCVAAIAFVVVIAIANVKAQSADINFSNATRPRQTTISSNVVKARASTLENDIEIVSEAAITANPITATAAHKTIDVPKFDSLKNAPNFLDMAHEQMILAAIEHRLGTPYIWGSSGPRGYDCSGFVWSVFQSAGIDFERSNARTLWERFAPTSGEARFRFGTLVFFNDLKHVGIVADERGFYHASSSHGVTYSLFDDYWTPRITGFRAVTAPVQIIARQQTAFRTAPIAKGF